MVELLFIRYVLPQLPQEIVAAHPILFPAAFEINLKVSEPVLDVIVPGTVSPEKFPITGDVVFGPS